MKAKTIKIFSENNDFQHAEVLKRNRVKRSKNKKFFVEGVNSINLCLENKWEIDTLVYSSERRLSNWSKEILNKSGAKKHLDMPISLLKKLSDKQDYSELLALVKMKEDNLDRLKITENLFIVVIDRASNPGNLGTIIRSSESFGVDAIILIGHSIDLYDPKTIRASVGSIFSIPVIRIQSLNKLNLLIEKIKTEIGLCEIIGTTVKTDQTIDKIKFKTPLILLIGNETTGLSNNFKKISDKLVKIPINGSTSSLNVACATSIFLYEINRQIKNKSSKSIIE